MKRFTALSILLANLILPAEVFAQYTLAPDNGTPGANDANIRAVLAAAAADTGDVTIEFQTGTYVLTDLVSTLSYKFSVDDPTWLSLHIYGNSSTFIMKGDSGAADGMENLGFLRIAGGSSITIEDLTVDYQDDMGRPSTATQGVVLRQLYLDPMNPTIKTGIRFQVDAGYGPPIVGDITATPGLWVEPYAFSRFFVPSTVGQETLRPNTVNRVYTSISPYMGSSTIFDLKHQNVHVSLDGVQAGDTLVLPRPNQLQQPCIRLLRCVDVSLFGVVVQTAPGFGVQPTSCESVHICGSKIEPGPDPIGASRPRLFTTNRDGIHLTASRGSVRVENCEVSLTGDDAITVHPETYELLEVTGGGTVIKIDTNANPGFNTPEVGDRLRTFNPGASNTPVDCPTEGMGSQEEDLNSVRELVVVAILSQTGSTYELEIRDPLTSGQFALSMEIANSDRAVGTGAQIRGNKLGNISGRGIMARGGPVLIENNDLYVTRGAGISILSELGHPLGGPLTHNGGFVSGIVIRNNNIVEAYVREGGDDFFRGAINVIHREFSYARANIFSDAQIYGNTIESCHGPNILVSNAAGVVIAGNVFEDAGQNPAGEQGGAVNLDAVVDLEDVAGVTFADNSLVNWNSTGVIVDARNASDIFPEPDPAAGFTIN